MSLRFTSGEATLVAELGTVHGVTPTTGTELGTELGFVATLLVNVLGGTPISDVELGTEVGVISVVG